jgi:uncharacterized protein
VTVPARLSLVTLSVPDVERAAAFYERIGWRRSAASVSGEVAFFALAPGTVLSLWNGLADDTGRPVPPPGAVVLALNVDTAEDVERVAREFADAGGSVVRPTTRAPWGGTTAYVADLDGHLWEVAHNPGFALDERGAAQLP